MSRINTSPSNKQCGYCDRTLERVATRAHFTPDPVWRHSAPALVCPQCDKSSAMRSTRSA